MSSTDDALRILEAVKDTYKDVPWFRGANLDTDDAGLHVVAHAQKSAIPPEGVDEIGVVDGVRVLVAVHG
jgi:ribosomal protein L22